MAFPADPLGLRVELELPDGWTDITGDVLTARGIEHQRGMDDMASSVDPSETRLLLDNSSGKYTPRNPLSPLYGQIGRGTPLRVTLPGSESYLRLPGTYATAYTNSSLNVTGDLDIRADVALEVWRADPAIDLIELAGKYNTSGNQRSWLFAVGQSGAAVLRWSPDGVALIQAASSVPITVPASGRVAVRALLDRDNGAGGHTVTFWTAPTIDGPWTQLGTPVVGAGTTSVFASTSTVEVGGTGGVTFQNPAGRMYACQLRDGATLLATADFRQLAPGTTSWTDSVGRSWTLWADGAIDNRRVIAMGQVPQWPQKWEPSGTYATTEITAWGPLRRYRQGTKQLESALRRRIPASQPIAYWPMEDGGLASQAYSPIPGVAPLKLTRATWAADNTLPSSEPLPTLPTSGALAELSASVPGARRGAAVLTEWSVRMLYRHAQGPTQARRTMLRIHTTGTAKTWWIQQGAAALGSRVYATSDDEDVLVDQGIASGDDIWGQWVLLTFRATQTATSTVTWRITWQDVGGDAASITGTMTGKVGRPTRLTGPPDGYSSELGGMSLGHLSVWPTADTSAYTRAMVGWSGETAGERMARLASEESLPLTVSGDLTQQQPVGPQRPLPWLELLEEAAAVDAGLLCEDRERGTLVYRGRASLYNQRPVLTLEYGRHLAPPLEPVEDDRSLRNDVTVSRIDGSSARAVLESGPLSVQPPPVGVGRYDTSLSLNLATDEQTESAASWRLHLGTWDEARYPAVTVRLHRHPELIPSMLALREGDLIRITGLPKWAGSDAADLLVMGLRELLEDFRWTVTLHCTPAGPYTVGVLEDPVLGRADTDGTELASAVTATATALPVTVTAGPAWITAPAPTAFDRFPTAAVGGWGTAEVGGAWAWSGGAAADYSVTGGIARHAHPSRAVFRITTLPVSLADIDETVLWSMPTVPVGDAHYVWLMARYASGNTFLSARIHLQTSGIPLLTVRDRINGVETSSGAATLAAFTPGAWYRLRLQVTGTTARARCWLDGTTEPTAWQATWTTAITAAGQVGVRSLVPAASTAPLPVTFSFREFAARPYSAAALPTEFPWNIRLGGEVCTVTGITGAGPAQTMTVIRAANGISKAHPAGTAVSLATPSVVAL
ncbi:hypothetical protein [Streptomyces sp. NPDC002644]